MVVVRGLDSESLAVAEMAEPVMSVSDSVVLVRKAASGRWAFPGMAEPELSVSDSVVPRSV